MATVGFLHTSPLHVATFSGLAEEVLDGVEVISVVDELLLDRARVVGPDHPEVLGALADRLAHFADVDTVICTCSTIGGVAEWVGREAGLHVVRVDRPMAEQAVVSGERIGVLATVESTLGPTTRLLADVAQQLGRAPQVEVTVVPGAWSAFESGDTVAYLDLVAAAIADVAAVCDVVVLAQSSMAGAAELVAVDVPVLSSPRLAVESLL